MKSIKSKIFIGFIGVIIIFLSLIFTIFIVNSNLTNNYRNINNNIIKEENLRDGISDLIEISYRSFNTGDYSPYYEKLEEVKKIEKDLDLLFLDDQINNKTKLAYRSFKNSFNAVIDSVEKSKFDIQEKGTIVGVSSAYQETRSKFNLVSENITNLILLEAENLSETISYIDRNQSFLFNVISISIFVIIVIIIIFVFIFSKQITKPLFSLSLLSQKISSGDFSFTVDSSLINRDDEVGKLSNSFDLMIKKIKNEIENSRIINSKLSEKLEDLSKSNEDFENSQKAVMNLLEDIEEEKSLSEDLASNLEKFKLAVDNVSDNVVITDTEGIVIYGNKAMEKITGYKIKEVIGKKAGSLWRSDKNPKDFYENMWDTIKNKKEPFLGEIINKRKNGEDYQAMINISPILDNKREIVFFVGLQRDITKEKEIDKAKTELISLASHQLRTPLSTINWYTEMLLSGDAGEINEDQKSYLEEIYTGNQRMVDLVNALLNVSRLELGTFMIEPHMDNIVSLGESIIKEIKPLADIRKQKLELTHDDNIPEISIDSKLLRMVMQNLLSNSIKYTQEEGQINLNMRIVNKGDNIDGVIIKDDSVLVSVSDNGYGITNSQQDKIFTKLFRADNIKDKSTEGTGLGLYIIKIIVDNGGGQIWFKSEENKGTTFYFTVLLSGMKRKEGSKTLS